ncbi:unnamed protein product [Trichogramma brassicae]|uniref:Uncharacterized protein n=1 Tax=Trichogramma brassicae TaxID=86971 RepID=A0A6H5I458_9HYME|nr:unnamed protein product [Trichogramma brassicae]
MVWFDLDTNEEIHDSDDSDYEECGQEDLAKLKSLRENVKLEVREERIQLLRQLHSLIVRWKGPFPDFRDFFRPEEMDLLLSEDVEYNSGRQKLIRFVARCGYKDEPELDENGEPSLNRHTALHQYHRCPWFGEMMPELFQIYDRFDANYVDEIGVTHLHVASKLGCDEVVQKFLEHEHDPNCVEQREGQSALHLALLYGRRKVAELLLRNGAKPSLANRWGQTALHVVCARHYMPMTT